MKVYDVRFDVFADRWWPDFLRDKREFVLAESLPAALAAVESAWLGREYTTEIGEPMVKPPEGHFKHPMPEAEGTWHLVTDRVEFRSIAAVDGLEGVTDAALANLPKREDCPRADVKGIDVFRVELDIFTAAGSKVRGGVDYLTLGVDVRDVLDAEDKNKIEFSGDASQLDEEERLTDKYVRSCTRVGSLDRLTARTEECIRSDDWLAFGEESDGGENDVE